MSHTPCAEAATVSAQITGFFHDLLQRTLPPARPWVGRSPPQLALRMTVEPNGMTSMEQDSLG